MAMAAQSAHGCLAGLPGRTNHDDQRWPLYIINRMTAEVAGAPDQGHRKLRRNQQR